MKSLIRFLTLNKTKIINFIAIKLYQIGLMPPEYKEKAKSLYFRKKLDKEFFKSKLIYNNNGFYYLDPMPKAI